MTVSDGASFGAKLKRLRQAANLTQEELAERAGLTAKGIGALERGERRRPYPHTVRALSDALGLSEREAAELASTVPSHGSSDEAPSTHALSEFPALPTPLVGREQDIAALEAALEGGARLVTLLGPGGVGKTSLAIEVGRRLRQTFPGGVAFVALARLDNPELLLQSVADALGLRETGGRSLRDVLGTALRDRAALIILDNFEHLAPAAADVADLLAMAPSVSILVTSRSPLRLRGEREIVVPPLALPGPGQGLDNPSVQLFVQRATAIDSSFCLTEANADDVASICRRLEGLPLAIELAAARTRVLSPAALLSRLDSLLPVLTGGPVDLPDRQRTIRASITWSYELLSDVERLLFRRLSLFAGGWTMEGAEAMLPSVELLDVLGRLVEASLVVGDSARDRYRMLEPVREYAFEVLDACREAGEVRDRHAAFYRALALDAEPGLKAGEQLLWLKRLEEEHDNIRSALSWLLGQPGSGRAEALRVAASLGRFWYLRGHWSEGRDWLAKAIAADPGGARADRAKALEGAGLIAQFQNDYEQAAAYLDEGAGLYRTLGDRGGEASALAKRGFIAAFQNDRELVDFYSEALAPFGDDDVEDPTVAGTVLVFLGLAAVIQGDIDRCLRLNEQALSIYRKAEDMHGMTWCLTNAGLMYMVKGDRCPATAMLQEDLGLSIQLGEPSSAQYALLGLATIASQEGQPVRAARLWGAAEAIRHAAGMDLNALARAQTMYDTWVEHAREAVGADVFAENWALGVEMSLEQAHAYAIAPAERR